MWEGPDRDVGEDASWLSQECLLLFPPAGAAACNPRTVGGCVEDLTVRFFWIFCLFGRTVCAAE